VTGIFGRVRAGLRTFREDLRRPLDGTEGLSRRGRFGRRFRFLLKKYGWRLLLVAFFYYLIRDLILYVILPYLAARHILMD
jgi:hypothetical protein